LGEISPGLLCKLEIVNVDCFDIAVLEVPSGKNKPYVLSGVIYVRVGPNTQKLTTAGEMRDFFQQTDKLYFDESICAEFNSSKQIDPANLKIFRTDANIHPSITDHQILKNLQLFDEEGRFKSGAVLFFGEHPEAFYEQAIIRCVMFNGNDKRFISDDKKFGGPLFQQYLQAKEWIRGKINISYYIEGKGSGARKELWEIPAKVFKEEIIKSRARTLLYAIPAIILLFLTFISMKQNNKQKFYWTFLVGLSIFQILPIAGLLNINSESSLFMICFLLTSFISFAIGQLFSIYKFLESRKIYSTKKE